MKLLGKDGNPGVYTAASLVVSIARFGIHGTKCSRVPNCKHPFISRLGGQSTAAEIYQYSTFLDVLRPSGRAGDDGFLGIGVRRRVY